MQPTEPRPSPLWGPVPQKISSEKRWSRLMRVGVLVALGFITWGGIAAGAYWLARLLA